MHTDFIILSGRKRYSPKNNHEIIESVLKCFEHGCPEVLSFKDFK